MWLQDGGTILPCAVESLQLKITNTCAHFQNHAHNFQYAYVRATGTRRYASRRGRSSIPVPPFCTGRDAIKHVLDSYCVFGYIHGLPDSQRPSSPSVRKDKPHLSLHRSLHGVPCTTAIKRSVSEINAARSAKRKYNLLEESLSIFVLCRFYREFLRPSYDKSNTWGVVKTSYAGVGPAVSSLEASGKGSISRSHRHYGTGCVNLWVPVSMSHSLLSAVRDYLTILLEDIVLSLIFAYSICLLTFSHETMSVHSCKWLLQKNVQFCRLNTSSLLILHCYEAS